MHDRLAKNLLEQLSGKLLELLTKDDMHAPATAARRLTQAGEGLEALLRELVSKTAVVERVHPEDMLTPPGGRRPNLRKMTMGQLAYGVRDYFTRHAPTDLPVTSKPLVDDLVSSTSVILAFIQARNEAAKTGADETKLAAGQTATTALIALLTTYRTDATWK